MSCHATAWLAWSLCAVSLTLLGFSVLLAFLGRPVPLLEESASWYGQAIFAAGSAGAPVLGALIASRHPENPYGWLWLGFGLALAVLAFGGNYAEYAILSGNLLAPVTVAAVGSAGWMLWVALTPFLLLLFPELTDREREILDLVAAGRNNQEIAEGLYLSLKTVRNYVSNIFTKLQVADREQAIVRAREAGLGRGDERP